MQPFVKWNVILCASPQNLEMFECDNLAKQAYNLVHCITILVPHFFGEDVTAHIPKQNKKYIPKQKKQNKKYIPGS
jgi:hypothetical protein